ncbi:MAG TPA: FtsX-like permease family protein [Clostridia bacterium]|nr:FtsX-like permease family protein [Clostridia bacterium]
MLWRKMWRELKENKGTYFACVVIITMGLMVFTSFSIVVDNLYSAQKNFYLQQNFADGFAEVEAMPLSEVKKLKAIEGIKEIEGRLSKEVRVLTSDSKENVYLRLFSLDPEQTNPINGVLLEKGTPLAKDTLNIWLDSKFFAANNLALNDSLEIIAQGKKRNLRIVGTGSSPEFIYALRNTSDLFPSPETFGIAYLPNEIMKTLFAEHSAVNNLVFTLQPGADYQDVEARLQTELKLYGLKSIYPRKDQVSHLLLTQELTQLEGMSKTLPLIFLAVACMILYIMLKRMIEKQRGQIGILKAFGYTQGEILWHYLSFALVIGFCGGALGGISGILLSTPLTALYEMFFNIPGLRSGFSLSYLLSSILLTLIFTLFAGYQGCKGVLSLEPAEAMRPPAPPTGKTIFLEKFSLFWQALTVQGKMSLRNMIRHPGRTIFLFLGIMFTFSLVGSPWSMWDLSEKMLFDQYEKIETYDVKINLTQPLPQQQVERELSRFPGVKTVESRAEIPVTLKNNWHKKEVVLLGLPANSALYKIRDKKGQQIEPPRKGILLSERLAQLLGAKVGTHLSLESLMAKNPDQEKTVEVTGIIPQYIGLNAYMELSSLQKLLAQGKITTSLMLCLDEQSLSLLQREYSNSTVIAGIEDKKKLLQQSKELMASFSGTIYIFLLIGLIIGFAIIYNISLTTVSERNRELASMMVLGMTPQEVLAVITFEQWFISIFAMLAGIPLSKLFLISMNQSINNDLFTMPTNLNSTAILAGFLVTIACIRIAQWTAFRKIKQISLATALKASE